MAITLLAAAAAASGTTSALPPYPAGLTPTSITFLTVTAKPYNSIIATPSGWSKIGEATNGSTASGVDTGSTIVAEFYRIGAFTGTQAIAASGSDSLAGEMVAYQKSDTDKVWQVTFTTGGDATDGANYSATGAADLSITAGDVLHVGTAINADTGTLSAITLAATSATFGGGTVTDVNTGYTDGNDGRILTTHAICTSGTSSAAPVLTFTNASTSSGTSFFVRLRVTQPGISIAFNFSQDSPGYNISLSNTFTSTTQKMTRNDPSGIYPSTAVRGLDMVSTAVTTVTDYEAPFVTGQIYTFTTYIDSTLMSSNDINVPTEQYVTDSIPTTYAEFYTKNSYIKDVNDPTKSLATAVGDFRTQTVPGRILGEHTILGRRLPVIVTDETGARNGTMEIYSININNYGRKSTTAIETLLDSGHVLLYQNVPFPADIKDMYFVVKSWTREIKGVVAAGKDLTFKYQVEFQEVDKPSTLTVPSVSTATWQDLLSDPAFSTWNDVRNYGSWLAVLQKYI